MDQFNNNKDLSFFASAKAKTPERSMTLSELLQHVKSGDYRELVTRIRDLKSAGQTGAAAELKHKLPAVTLSCKMTTRDASVAADDKIVHHTGLLQIDLDGADNPNLADPAEIQKLRDDKHVLALFRSPSGDGYKLVVRINGDVATHKDCFRSAERYFKERGFTVDPATKDVARLCFVSYDPDAILKDEQADAVEPFDPDVREQRQAVYYPPSGTIAEDVAEMLSMIPPKPSYDDWLRISSAVWGALGEQDGTAALKKWSPEEADGEYDRKFKHRLTNIGVGTLCFYAKQYGYDAVIAARRAKFGGRVYFGGQAVPAELAEKRLDDILTDKKSAKDSLTNEMRIVKVLDGQTGAAETFAMIEDEWRYVPQLDLWRFYNGRVWVTDTSGQIRLRLKNRLNAELDKLIDYIKDLVKAEPAPKGEKDSRVEIIDKLGAVKNKNTELRWINAVLTLARPLMSVPADAFDCKPHLLATQNGTIDFSLNDFRQSRPDDYLTMSVPVTFNPDATAPVFEKFINDIFCDNQALIGYVQRLAGYCLTGSINENCLFFLYGSGANGKSIFRRALEMLFGSDLKSEITIQTLLNLQSDANSDYQKARLKGTRIAFTDEIPSNKRFNAGQIKALTGSDTILARNPYERPYSFSPTHKLILIGNDKPLVSEMDNGTWRRINIIPFSRSFRKDEQIPQSVFEAKFRDELPGILNWAIKGYLNYKSVGLLPPDEVKLATEDYREENDQLKLFMDDILSEDPTARLKITEAFTAYLAWCKESGLYPTIPTKHKFTKSLKARGFSVVVGHSNQSFLYNYFIANN